jgi:hypothetical protein
MAEWHFAQTNPEEELALLHHYSVKKRQAGREIEFIITVKEFATPKEENLRYFALADKQTNQKTAPFTPCGWGNTMLRALAECVQNIHRFPYEGA